MPLLGTQRFIRPPQGPIQCTTLLTYNTHFNETVSSKVEDEFLFLVSALAGILCL